VSIASLCTSNMWKHTFVLFQLFSSMQTMPATKMPRRIIIPTFTASLPLVNVDGTSSQHNVCQMLHT